MNGGVLRMNQKKKIIAICMIAFLFFEILFSYDYMIEKAHHDCSGRDCPVCMQIERAAQFISSMKFIPVLPCIVAVFFTFLRKNFIKKEGNCKKNTLITLKVELLN